MPVNVNVNVNAMQFALLESFDAKEMLAYQHSEPNNDKRGAMVDELRITPLGLIERIAALVPPTRTHRRRYFGVLAPNSPLSAAMTAIAQSPTRQTAPGWLFLGDC